VIRLQLSFQRMNVSNYVKHPTISRERLDGKSLARCKNGDSFRFTLVVGEPLKDGRYSLRLQAAPEPSKPDSEGRTTYWAREVELDQSTVDKVVAVVSGSPLHGLHYNFAILEDSESMYLNAKVP
jgi:hypothetical protein